MFFPNSLDSRPLIENNYQYQPRATSPEPSSIINAYIKGVPMLHDLYLLSCYFEPNQAVMYEEDLKRRYGLKAVSEALRNGLIELYCPPCARGKSTFFCRLSPRGLNEIAG